MDCSKRTIWVSIEEYQRLTTEDHAQWNFGIDLTRGGDWRNYDPQKDHDEYIEEMSLGGKPYRVPR